MSLEPPPCVGGDNEHRQFRPCFSLVSLEFGDPSWSPVLGALCFPEEGAAIHPGICAHALEDVCSALAFLYLDDFVVGEVLTQLGLESQFKGLALELH